ncbi:MAG: YidC/Oxa1 family membrane protein insertase [Fimbriimonas sp.]
MSKPAAPPPKQNFLQTALLVMVIWTGFMLWTNGQKAPQVPPGDLLATLKKQNRDLLDASIVSTNAQYSRTIDQQLQEKKISADEAQRKKIEGAILVADTQLKAGIQTHRTDKLRNAHNTLVAVNRQLRDKPLWNTPVAVTDVSGDKRFGWKEWKGQDLYDRTTKELIARNKTELVWGFIPGYQLMDFLVGLTGHTPAISYAIAAFLLALLVRSAVFRLATKQIMSGRRMSQLMPLVKEIKDAHPDDAVTQNQKTMALYKEYGVNPFAGCGPAFVQMPLFYTIYMCMVAYQFEFEKGTFLWINPATSKATNGFIAPNLGQQDTILILIYGITMLITTLLTPVSDPAQARQQRLMGVGITVIFTGFMFAGAVPVVSGFVLYWIFTNILATAQSLVLYRRPMPPLQKVNTAAGGVYPTGGLGGRFGKLMEQMQQAAEQQGHPGAQGPKGGNGKPTNGGGNVFLGTGETKTGTPAKHKPKKRK